MLTLGYGDIVPITSPERIFSIVVTLMSCGVFAYSLQTSKFPHSPTPNKLNLKK